MLVDPDKRPRRERSSCGAFGLTAAETGLGWISARQLCKLPATALTDPRLGRFSFLTLRASDVPSLGLKPMAPSWIPRGRLKIRPRCFSATILVADPAINPMPFHSWDQ